MNKKGILFLLFIIAVSSTFLFTKSAVAEPTQVLLNTWPNNITKLSDWNYNQYISYQVCCKAPAPPDGINKNGGAFKNGDGGNSNEGSGVAGEWATMWQDFNLNDKNIAYSDTYLVTFQWLLISVTPSSGHNILNASLYGWNENQEPQFITYLYEFEEINGIETEPCDNTTYWNTYCSQPIIVPHYDHFRLQIDSWFSQSDATLGMKWTGLELNFDPLTNNPLPTPTITNTPAPTATATQEPQITFLPLIFGTKAEILGLGCTPVVVDSGTSEEGNWILVECN